MKRAEDDFLRIVVGKPLGWAVRRYGIGRVFMVFMLLGSVWLYSIGAAQPGHPPFGQISDDTAGLIGFLLSIASSIAVGRLLWGYRRSIALITAILLWVPFFMIDTFSLQGAIVGWGFGACALWLLLRGVRSLLRKSDDFRGWEGEAWVAFQLRRFERRDRSGYRLLNNLLLEAGTHSAEIDHVLITRCGVFVIETKAWARAHVSADGRWFRGVSESTATEVHSPLQQNQGHVRMLRTVLGDVKCIPLVVLTQAQVTGLVPRGVVTLSQLRKTIRSFDRIELDDARVQALAEQLQQANVTDPVRRRERQQRMRVRDAMHHPGSVWSPISPKLAFKVFRCKVCQRS